MIFAVDIPPSTNRMYRRAGNIIHKSAEYREWLVTAGWQLAAQCKGFNRINSECAVELFAGKMHASRDVDSIIKPIGDFLQHAQVVTNDKLIRQWNVAADCDSVPRNTVMVTIREMGREAA